ncbi:MAG: hypothetical protein AAFW74_12910, partial [Pseudomonadota bacterium]
SETLIGDPDNPVRTDVSSAVYSGQGLLLRATDAEGSTTATLYDDFGRPVLVTAPDASSVSYSYAYGLPALFGLTGQDFAGLCAASFVTDENGVTSASFSDAYGRLRREVMNYNGASHADITTEYEYDDQDRLVKVIAPSGDETEYIYDAFGRVRYKTQPDLGTISYNYDKLGRMRFVQDQRQSDESLLGFYQYDDLGRITAIGEAVLLGADSTGGSGGEPSVRRKRGSGDATASIVLTSLNRFSDLADPDQINTASAGHSTATVNPSLYVNPTVTPPQIPLVSSTTCMPAGASSAYQRSDAPTSLPYITHTALVTATQALVMQPELFNFEHAATFPQFLRTVIHYDELPPQAGTAFMHFPSHADWNRLAPTGSVRNLKGREAAVAYRNSPEEAFHYHVMSYDERGRVEALIRYTENIGFDATYYEYNAMNQVIAVRNADGLREHAVFYGTDHNGRVNEVSAALSASSSGLGFVNPAFPSTPLNKPLQTDLAYSFNKRGQISGRTYTQINWAVSYSYDTRGR